MTAPSTLAKDSEKPEILSYQDYRAFLSQVAEAQQTATGRPISLHRWARRIGYKSPRSIAMVLKGQRFPSQEMVYAISKDLGLSAIEERYLGLLVLLERSRKRGKDLRAIIEDLKAINPKM